MKRFVLLFVFLFFAQIATFAATTFSNEQNLWGIKNSNEEILVEPQYKKLIILGENTYIAQRKGKFGIIDVNNNILVPLKYTNAERILCEFVKLGNGSKFGLYDKNGSELLPVEYSSIDILFGRMFLTCKNFKYGIIDFDGNIVLENKFDDIYMPNKSTMRIKYNGEWYELEKAHEEDLNVPKTIEELKNDDSIAVFKILEHPMSVTSYSVVTCTDYFIKLFSSISPAHEKTIDTLMLSQGADALGIYFRLGWIPKYPVVFTKNYINTIKNPSSGPLSDIKIDLKQKFNN